MQTSLFRWAEDYRVPMKEMADLLGYSYEHLSRLKHGHEPVTPEFRDRCIRRLGKDAEYLFFEEGESVPEYLKLNLKISGEVVSNDR